jgi:iron(III) transport system permease protein
VPRTETDGRLTIGPLAAAPLKSGTGGGALPPVSAILLVLLLGLPIIWLAIAAFSATGAGGLAANMLPTALRETGTLMVSVGAITGVLGLVSAWLVSHFEFPGRRQFEWALVLPLAIPTYLAAYTWVEFLDFTGPIQQAVRAIFGGATINDYWFPQIRSPAGGAFVLSLVLYPYVYAACRAFFVMQSGSMAVAARALGAGGYRTFFSVTLPLSRPALVVGVTLAMMEVVNDLGAVQYFGVNSLTAVIYSTWINRSNFGGAAQLAVTIVLVIALLILIEQWARRDRVYMLHRDNRVAPPRERLTASRSAFAATFCGALVLLGFGIPAGLLLVLALRNLGPDTLGLTFGAGLTTVTLAAFGAFITVAIGWATARLGTRRSAHGLIRIATLGYAIPGTVLALGLLQPLGQADLWFNRLTMALANWRPGLILSGSIAALLYLYAIRFLAVSHSTIDAAMKKRGDSMLDAGRVLGVTGWRLLLRVDLPTLSPALLTAATLVFVEIVKELPGTLLLRPLGVETLATLVYARANVSLFTEAALPALAIVLIGLAPVILSTRLSDRR